jgi:hypothetical protein
MKMMGQQQAVAEKATGLRRIVLALTLAVVLVAMMALTASPAFAVKGFPGEGFAKGPNDTNPGRSVNNKVGDSKNNVANPNCDPFDGGKSNSPNGSGCENN